mgnify:CR=1 FL=1
MKNKKKISASEQRTLWGSRVVIWITMIVVLFPVIWIVMSSFSAGDSFFLSSLFPEKFSIEHYVELFRETDFGIWVFNSLKFCFIVAIIQLVLTSLAAYAFARLRFVGRKYGLMALLILQVFPNSMADTFPFSGIRYAGTAGCGVKCSSPFFMDKIWLPNIICFHILINSMVDPLKRATKPLP